MYKGKKVAIIGMARTGLAAAEVLKNIGAEAVLFDRKPESELKDALETAARTGVQARPGTDEVDLTGFDLLIPSPGVPAYSPIFADARRLGIEIISEIELAYRVSKAPIIAITGTNGKTTTTVMAGRMMEADGRETYIGGNVAAGDLKLPLVTAAYKASPDAILVAEISTFQLEWIKDFRPRAAALLNVTSDHMDRHKSVEEYASLKARIFENGTDDDYAVVNAENQFTASLAPNLKGKVFRFGWSEDTVFPDGADMPYGAFVRGDELVVRFDGEEITVCRRSDIRLRGAHNVENVLAAACCALAMGARPESIATAVREFVPVEHRLESVAVVDGVEYINNSMCTNVDAAARSVEAIEEPQIIIAGGKDKGADYTRLGEAIARKAKHLVLIGADAGLIADVAQKAGFSDMTRAGSMRDAVIIAKEKAVPGDVVVLTPGCASFDMFSSFEERGCIFKSVVRELQGRGEQG